MKQLKLIKNKMKESKWVLGFSLIVCLTMCNCNVQFGNSGSGKITEQERKLPDFSGIEVGGGIDLYIAQGDTQKVLIVTDENIQSKIITKVEDNILVINTENWLFRTSTLKVFVTVKDIKSLSASGGTDVYTEKQFIAGNIKLKISGGSDVKLNLKAIEIAAILSGGSDLFMSGAAGYLQIDASGGSDCKAYELTVAKAKISTSGGSDVYITVDEELNAHASGGSDVMYRGSVKNVNASSSGGSDIKRE
jgi:hypothetical protein